MCGLGVGACHNSPPSLSDARLADAQVVAVQRGVVFDPEHNPIVRVKVCLLNQGDVPCVNTDDDGGYAISVPGLPIDADIAVTDTRSGYLGNVSLLHETTTQTVWPASMTLLNNSEAITLLATHAGFTYDNESVSDPSGGTGFIRLRVYDLGFTPLAGATATLSPPSGMGPIYGDLSGAPDPSLALTTSSGVMMFGNIPPGTVTITVTVPAMSCGVRVGGAVAFGDWLPLQAGTISAVTVPNSLTDGLVVFCE